MSTSSENRKPEAQETRGQTPGGPTPGGHDGPGRLNEMAAGGMDSLLMAQPVLWAGVVAGFWQASPDAFQKFARLAGQAKARAEGRFPGRRPSLTEQQREYIQVERSKGVSQRELAKLLEVSRWTIQQVDR